jgi:hypothetical protein
MTHFWIKKIILTQVKRLVIPNKLKVYSGKYSRGHKHTMCQSAWQWISEWYVCFYLLSNFTSRWCLVVYKKNTSVCVSWMIVVYHKLSCGKQLLHGRNISLRGVWLYENNFTLPIVVLLWVFSPISSVVSK